MLSCFLSPYPCFSVNWGKDLPLSCEVDELLGSDLSASRFMELQDGMTSGCLGALVWKCGSLDSKSPVEVC